MALPSAAMALAQEAASGSMIPRERPIFPWWHALLVAPGREQKSADWLRDKAAIEVYWPHYTKQIGRKRAGQKRRTRLAGAIPGMLFAPIDFLHNLTDEMLEFAHIYGFMLGCDREPARLTKIDIEKVRNMEARLNLPPEAKGVLFKLGEKVRFTDDLFTDWGDGTIFEIASEARIGVEVTRLFGRATKVYVPASEIEAM